MRRGRRELRQKSYSRNLLFLVGGFLLLIILTFAITFAVYNNKLKNSTYSTLTAEKIAELVPNDVEGDSQEVEQASTEIGKTIEEVINTMENKIEENQNNTTEENTEKTTSVQTEESNKQIEEVAERPVVIKDPEFIRPVEGEVARNFAKDTLIYSETLDEWITHLGIDIKAERTTVVKSAEKGKVIAIKNDPRYGLTVIVEHINGFKTVYSNLLTTEFVSEGEEIEKGQSIGTVGNSASFEICDEPHLHFEILKDDVNVDPTIYWQVRKGDYSLFLLDTAVKIIYKV